MSKIKMSVSKPPEQPESEPEPESADDPGTEEWKRDARAGRPEPSPEDKEKATKALAEKVAKDVAKTSKPKAKSAPLTKKVITPTDPDEDLNIDPEANYPKIALVRISVGTDDERSMDEWTEQIRKDLSKHKNATVLTQHRLINGKQVANHRYEEELLDGN